MDRILEPEVMDTAEEAADYDAMNHSAVNQLFVDDLLAVRPNEASPASHMSGKPLDEESSGEDSSGEAGWDVVDLGCGTAQLPILLCEQDEQARVLALDLSIEMLDLARLNVEAAGLIDRIQLAHGDAKGAEFEDHAFDAAISNSIVHHIPEPAMVLAEIRRIVKPGGLIFVRDLMRPDSPEQLDQLVRTYAGEESEHAQQMFRDSLHAALTVAEMRQLIRDLGYDASTVQATSDRHWTWSAIQAS